jgi:hypothetical protein
MDYSSNEALVEDPNYTSQGAFPVWIKVFTKPGEQTFLDITAHPEARARAAYIWVYVVGTLSALIGSLTQFVAALIGLRAAMPDIGEIQGLPAVVGVGGLLSAVCSAPLAGLFSVAGFAFGAAIVHATAKFFGGEGQYDKLAYAFGAIAAPFSIVSGLMAPLYVIPIVGFCAVPILLGVGIYVLYLQVAAIKAVHRLGWGESAGALFLPGILISLLCAVLFVALWRMVGPSLNDILQQLQQIQPGLQ